MKNDEIIEQIKHNLTGAKETDVIYLQTELAIYRQMKNDEVTYAIANMLFQYLDPAIKQRLDLKTHAVLDERRAKYEQVLSLIEQKEITKAKTILEELIDPFRKATFIKDQNYYDFDQMIEYFIFCENVQKAKSLKIRRYPEPITYYIYQLANLYEEEQDFNKAISLLEEALNYNPRCQYVMENLALLYEKNHQIEKAFMIMQDSLRYAYTKEQLAYAYQFFGRYYLAKNNYEMALVSYVTSDYFKENPNNQQKVKEITQIIGRPNLTKPDDITNIFAKNHLQYGVSTIVIKAIEEFIAYSKEKNDQDTLVYLLTIAYELTDDDRYHQALLKTK